MPLIEQLKQIPDHRHLRGRRYPFEVDESHSRRIQRHAQVFPPSAALQAKWRQLAFVGAVHRTGERDQQAFAETVYYLGSSTVDSHRPIARESTALAGRK